jgi:hypothetical protein
MSHKLEQPDTMKPHSSNTKTISPWRLTAAEAAAMDAVCEAGGHEGAAEALGVPVRIIRDRCNRAMRKIEAPGRITRYLKWDRWRHGVQP